jgi:hypothetical protein
MILNWIFIMPNFLFNCKFNQQSSVNTSWSEYRLNKLGLSRAKLRLCISYLIHFGSLTELNFTSGEYLVLLGWARDFAGGGGWGAGFSENKANLDQLGLELGLSLAIRFFFCNIVYAFSLHNHHPIWNIWAPLT